MSMFSHLVEDVGVEESPLRDLGINKAVPKGFVEELPDALRRTYANIASKLAGTAKWLSEMDAPLTPTWLLDKAGLEEVPDFIGKEADEIAAYWKEYGGRPELAPDVEQTAGAFVASAIGEGLIYGLATLGVGALAGATAAALFAFGVEGQSAYEDALENGATEDQANTERFIVGGINSLIEISNIGRIFRRTGAGATAGRTLLQHARNKAWKEVLKSGKKVSVDLVKTAFEEALEEALQGTTAEVAPKLLRGQEIPGGMTGFLHRRLYEAAAGGIAGAALGGAMTAGAAITGQTGTPKMSDSETNRLLNGDTISGVSEETLNNFDLPDPEARSVVEKFNRLMAEVPARKLRAVTEAERTQERGRRAGEAEEIYKSVEDPDQANALVSEVLSGELPKAAFTPFTDEQFSETDWRGLKNVVRTTDKLRTFERRRAFDALTKVQKGFVPTPSEAKLLGLVFGPTVTEVVQAAPKTFLDRVKSLAVDISGMPRAMLTAFDLSAMGRQNLILGAKHPILWAKNYLRGFRLLFDESYANRLMKDIQTSPHYDKIQKSKIYLGDWGDTKTAGDEHFQSELATKIPVLGNVVKASERAFVVTGNKFRTEVAEKYFDQWEGTARTTADYESLGAFINQASGRGTGDWLDKHGSTLSIAFFAPRWWASRIQLVGTGAKSLIDIATGKPSPVSKIAAGTLVSAFGAGVLALWLAKMAGMEVEDDWRSADFGKIKVGNTRIDFWAGYAPIMRTVGRMITGETKSTTTGEIYPIDRKEEFERYIQGKLAPIPGIIWEWWEGKQFMGEPLPETNDPAEMTTYILSKLTPLFIQDVVEACQYSDLRTGIYTAPLAFSGIGVQTYAPSAWDAETDIKNTYASQYFGANWNELGPMAQEALRDNVPQIVEAERIAKAEREDFSFVSKALQRQAEAGKKIFKALPDEVQTEMKVLGVGFGGVSDKIGRDWRLSQSRYEDYQYRLAKTANTVLQKLMGGSAYKNAPPALKIYMVEKILDLLKKSVRAQITDEANIQDLIRVQHLRRAGRG